MLFNPEKSKHLAKDSTVSMDGICLPKITTHSHLGVTVNENLSWDDHVSKLYTALCAAHRHSTKAEKQAQLNCFSKDSSALSDQR